MRGSRRRHPTKEGAVSKVRVHGFSVSLDGYGAGPDQRREEPLGRGGESLHDWLIATRTFQQMQRSPKPGTTGRDDELAARGFENLGAWIMGRSEERRVGKECRSRWSPYH